MVRECYKIQNFASCGCGVSHAETEDPACGSTLLSLNNYLDDTIDAPAVMFTPKSGLVIAVAIALAFAATADAKTCLNQVFNAKFGAVGYILNGTSSALKVRTAFPSTYI